MKPFFKLIFTIFPLILFLNILTIVGVSAQICSDISKVIDTNRNQFSTLRSNIKLVQYNSQFQESDTYEGKLKYIPSKTNNPLIRIDWTSPVQESLSIIDEKYNRIRPRVHENIAGEKKDNFEIKDILAFLNVPIKQLLNNYRLKYLGQEYIFNKILVWHLELIPKNAGKIKSIELWVNIDGMPMQVKRINNQNDSTTILISDLHLNMTMRKSDFKIFSK